MNFSRLASVAYPSRWGRPTFRFGQQVRFPGGTAIVTGMRYCVALVSASGLPLYEWHYELNHEVFVPADAIEPVVLEVA